MKDLLLVGRSFFSLLLGSIITFHKYHLPLSLKQSFEPCQALGVTKALPFLFAKYTCFSSSKEKFSGLGVYYLPHERYTVVTNHHLKLTLVYKKSKWKKYSLTLKKSDL